MRVGFLLEQCLAPVPGGTGRYSRELAAALARTRADGDHVVGYTAWHRTLDAARVAGVSGPLRLVLPRRALALAWERGLGPVPHGLDVIHAPTPLAPPRRRTPVVATIHDAVPWTHPETLTPRGVAFHRRMAARIARTADMVITDTEAVAAELASLLGLGDRIRVVPLGATEALQAPVPDEPERRRRLGLPDSGWFVTSATLEPRKGLDVALDALCLLDGVDVPLAITGPAGWGGVDVGAEVRRRGLDPARVRPLGFLPDADLAVVLRGAVALLQPSRAEGFGLPVVEAMALGVPSVCSDAPALVEVAGDAALIVPVGDAAALAGAMRALLDDPGLRDRLAAASLARAGLFTWQRAAERTWRVYRDVTGHGGREG